MKVAMKKEEMKMRKKRIHPRKRRRREVSINSFKRHLVKFMFCM